MVLADVPPERNPERGYIPMFPWNENWNEGTFAKTSETALLSASDISVWGWGGFHSADVLL